MTREVLGRGVQHEVRPERDRLLVDRRRERAIDAHERPPRVAQLRHELDVDAAQVRVRRRLGEEERDVMLVKGALKGGHVGRVDDGRLQRGE